MEHFILCDVFFFYLYLLFPTLFKNPFIRHCTYADTHGLANQQIPLCCCSRGVLGFIYLGFINVPDPADEDCFTSGRINQCSPYVSCLMKVKAPII